MILSYVRLSSQVYLTLKAFITSRRWSKECMWPSKRWHEHLLQVAGCVYLVYLPLSQCSVQQVRILQVSLQTITTWQQWNSSLNCNWEASYRHLCYLTAIVQMFKCAHAVWTSIFKERKKKDKFTSFDAMRCLTRGGELTKFMKWWAETCCTNTVSTF